MNISTIIAAIEKDREVIAAQVERLSEYTPKISIPVMSRADSALMASNLLDSTMQGHFQCAAEILNILGEVESNVRSRKPASSLEVIEAEVIHSEVAS